MFSFKDDDESRAVDQHREIVRRAFKLNCSSSSESDGLNKTDFKCAWLYLFGYKISKIDLEDYFTRLGKKYHTDRITFKDFEAKVVGEIKRLDAIEELRNAFMTIDFACKGFLTMDDIQKQFSIVAPHMKQNRLAEIFRELDRDCDGRISYKDFEIAMQYNPVDDDYADQHQHRYF